MLTQALVAEIGLLVEKNVVPATVSGEFTTFSPVARLRYQPLHIGGEQMHKPPVQVPVAAVMPAVVLRSTRSPGNNAVTLAATAAGSFCGSFSA